MPTRVAICTDSDSFSPFFKTNVAPAVSTYPTVPDVLATDPWQSGVDNGVKALDNNEGVQSGNFGGFDFLGTGPGGMFNARLVGWKKVQSGLFAPQWRSFLIADLLITLTSGTLGTGSGLSTTSRPYASTHSVAATIAVNSSLILPVNDQQPAATNPDSNLLWIDLRGINRLQMILGTGSGVTDANGLLYLL